MPDTDRLTAIIIGGGIGGLAVAIALRRIGVRPLVFEQAPKIQEVGAGISLWSNAIKALRQLDVGDQVAAQGVVIGTVKSITLSGQFLNEADFSQLSHRAGAPSICVHRADLQQTLADQLPPEVITTNARRHTGAAFLGRTLKRLRPLQEVSAKLNTPGNRKNAIVFRFPTGNAGLR